MKKSLEAELMSIAHRILQLRNRADIHELKTITGVLYEKLAVLSFTEKHFSGQQPTIGRKQVEQALEEKANVVEEKMEAPIASKTEPKKEGVEEARPDGSQYNPEGITEPNTEKIKDIVAQMPSETQEVEKVNDKASSKNREEDLRKMGVHYDDLPQFEPASGVKVTPSSEEKAVPKNEQPQIQQEKPETETPTPEKSKNLFSDFEPKERSTRNSANPHKTSLNDRLKRGINIGLNDRMAYIKHLFDGNATDYNRVLSQLNTIDSFSEAKEFIDTMVKPDYNDWENQEKYENRFLRAVENKFE